jgi:hypothetical protein
VEEANRIERPSKMDVMNSPALAVILVLAGPLQALVVLLPAILLAILSATILLFKPLACGRSSSASILNTWNKTEFKISLVRKTTQTRGRSGTACHRWSVGASR